MGNGNFKVRCIDNKGNQGIYTIGKVYSFIDGKMTTDIGTNQPYRLIKTFEEWEKYTYSTFKLVNDDVVVIRTNNLETIATLKDGKTIIKTAKAKCNPSDTFNAEFGRALALARLNNDQKMINWLLKGEEKTVIPTNTRIVKQDRYKYGDTVKIRDDLKLNKYYGMLTCLDDHLIAEKIQTVTEITQNGNYRVNKSKFIFSGGMFEGKVIEEPKTANFDWKGFLSGKFSVHCDTEEKAKKFLRDVKTHGVKWNSGSEIDENKTSWGIYKNNTNYSVKYNGLLYGDHTGEKNIVPYMPDSFIKVDISEFSTDEIIEELKKRLK